MPSHTFTSAFSYLCRKIIYAGKPQVDPNEFYNKGRNISMDCLYSRIPLAKWLLSKNVTVVGTLISNRTEISQ